MNEEISNTVIPANSITFEKLCDVFKQLYNSKKYRNKQDSILSEFIEYFRMFVANAPGKKNTTFYPILRLMLPACERERSPYNLKETKLGNLLVKVLSLKQSTDAQKLLNFRSVSSNHAQDSDFAGVAYMVLKTRVAQESANLTVGTINELLDRIAKPRTEGGSHEGVLDEVFSYAIKKLTAEQFKWLLRIILKDLKLGMSVDRILATFHPDAPELYRNCSNISKVCEELDDGDTRPSELGVQLFSAVRPMLSERLDVTHIHKLSEKPNTTYIIEDKFDGERFQLHMEDGKFEYFSRKGFSYSKNYGATYESGLLTPYLKDCFSQEAKSFILDGEMMGWHKERQCFGCKGMAYDIKKVTDNSKYRPCYCVFDILFYNGKSLVGTPEKGGLPLSERVTILDKLFKDIPGVIQLSVRQSMKDSADVLNALNKAIDNQDEGIVVKDVGSYYIANKRNGGWYKIKPEYTDDSMTDLDFAIVGADEAENKRQGRAKSFHIACIDNKPGVTTQWVCVGRVSSGLTEEERENLCKMLEANWKTARHNPIPPCLHFNKEKPDIWILPEHSTVLQVRATELIRSSGFGAQYTLRFPRVMRIRHDKPVADVITLHDFNQLVATRDPVVKLSNKRINESQLEQVEIKRHRTRTSKPKPEVPEQFRSKAVNVDVISKALLNRKLCVLSDDEEMKKPDLIRIIESHGGKHVQNPGPDTWCCIVGKLNRRVQNLIDTQEQDVISASWLCSLPPSETLCELSPVDMISIKRKTKLNLSLRYDAFGDSYQDETDEETLKKCFRKMDSELPIYLTTKEKLEVDQLLFGDNNPFSFLRGCTLHIIGNPLNGILARMYGADVIQDLTNIGTHVVVPKDTDRVQIEALKQRDVGILISEEWLEVCFKNKRKVIETEFLL